MWLLRQLCSLIDHRGPGLDYLMDVTGSFVVSDCKRCGTVIITALDKDVTKEDYEAVLDRWFVEWSHD